MQSSVGVHSPRLWLASVALAALAVSLLLAFASTMAPRLVANVERARGTTLETRFSTQAPETTAETPIAARTAKPSALGDQTAPLWALLAPWAFAVDVIAVLGLAGVLMVRYNARHRRRARM